MLLPLIEEEKIQCPFCKHDYVHIEKTASTIDSSECYPNGDRYKQGSIKVEMFCEDNPKKHKWVLVLGEHKGNLYYEYYKLDFEIPEKIDTPNKKIFYETFFDLFPDTYDLTPKVVIGQYVVDFVIEHNHYDIKKVIIECDETKAIKKTNSEIDYEKKRDRYLQANGYVVFHFSESEIKQNAHECVKEIYEFIH